MSFPRIMLCSMFSPMYSSHLASKLRGRLLRTPVRCIPRHQTTSAQTVPKREWLVILPDQEGALERRMAVRQKHLSTVAAEGEKGFWLLGGVMLSRPQEPSDTGIPPILGSVMLAKAETREEVLSRLKEDLYTKHEVWDWSKVQVWPFRSAVRAGMDGVR